MEYQNIATTEHVYFISITNSIRYIQVTVINAIASVERFRIRIEIFLEFMQVRTTHHSTLLSLRNSAFPECATTFHTLQCEISTYGEVIR